MLLLKTLLISCLLGLCLAKTEPKSRDKRQPNSYLRRGGKPPSYAVQMEPIVQYSQRDPIYNPLIASAKTDEGLYEDAPSYNYYPTEPEPIIEIIIKESNESLPAPPPVTASPTRRPAKQPIQVFYVKYEKKKAYGDAKPHVVYDAPVPALTPVEDHEEIIPDTSGVNSYDVQNENSYGVDLVTSSPEPSTTLRAIIRPDSETYHSGSSGIRVTFGTEQLPPNSHYKRSDPSHNETKSSNTSLSENLVSLTPQISSSSRRPHGPYLSQYNLPPRVQSGFPQQRIINSFPTQQQPQQDFYAQLVPPHVRSPPPRPSHRHPITIQGLPEVQQRQQFNTYVAPPRGNLNPPQHLPQVQPQPQSQIHQNFGSPTGHQNIQLQNDAHRNFNYQQQQQQQEKQRHQEQHRPDLLKQQNDQQRLLEQQRFFEQRLQEQKRKQQELEQQQLQYRPQLQKYNPGQLLHHTQQPPQTQPAKLNSEIYKAIPKLEQHIAIRENPLQPGPFPSYTPQELPQYGTKTKPFNPQPQVQKPVPVNNGQKPQQPAYQSYYSQNLFGENGRLSQNPSFFWSRPVYQNNDKIYATPLTTSENLTPTTPKPYNYKPYVSPTTKAPFTTTTSTTTTTTTTTSQPSTTLSPQKEAKIKQNIANLPAEVPDDIREQLLSSGILGNADIQILDYDKIGDTPIDSLPPEALANFYGAGGGSISLASEPIPSLAKKPKVEYKKVGIEPATLRPGGVEMKVVRFDPNTAQGQSLADKHIREDATRLGPVTVGPRDESQYNRYLPLKVSGASFPIPDVPELNGKKISSVVVLAPLDYNFHEENEALEQRQGRKISDVQSIRFLAGESLKQLVKKPTAENYKKWLEQERHTEPQKQSVVLLVTTPKNNTYGEKEIYMYDITSQTVSKLSGDLSSAFVDAAESNTDGSESITSTG